MKALVVKHDELQKHVQARANTKKVSQAHKKPSKAKPSTLHASQLDVSQLSLLPGSFIDEADQPVTSLDFAGLKRDATGLVLCRVADIVPFLEEDTHISAHPLAALTVGQISTELRGSLPIVDLAFPVMHDRAQKGILIDDSLLQLGQKIIKRCPAAKELKLSTIDTQALKLWLHRDQWPNDWSNFVRSPVRCIMDKFPNFVPGLLKFVGPDAFISTLLLVKMMAMRLSCWMYGHGPGPLTSSRRLLLTP